jgi:hypothetical protein
MTAKLIINGLETDMTLAPWKDISQYLKKGENKIEIVLHSSLRNLYGPHHWAYEVEPMGVSPYTFTMRGSWGEGTSKDYTHEYNSVPFGVDRVEVISTL